MQVFHVVKTTIEVLCGDGDSDEISEIKHKFCLLFAYNPHTSRTMLEELWIWVQSIEEKEKREQLQAVLSCHGNMSPEYKKQVHLDFSFSDSLPKEYLHLAGGKLN